MKLPCPRAALAALGTAATLAWSALPAAAAGPVLSAATAPGEEPASASAAPGGAFRRFALVAGTNDGGGKRVRLRYAASDAATFANVITALGGVRPEDLILLKGPTRAEFLDALENLRKRIAAAETDAGRSELLVYYSGHSDESGLLLGEEKVRYSEFRARIDAAPATIRLAVVDACASGALTRLKGGRRLPAFAVDQSSSLRGYAFLTSSSGNESAQESDRIRASFFTHYLVTGMRGAADLNLDGKVSLSEAYEFAFHETLSQTEGSQAGAQHPSYDMRLTGTGDLVLTDLRGTSAGVVLDRALQGRLFVRSATGALVAELQKQPGRKVELGLDPGLYDLGLDMGDTYYRGLFKVDSLGHHPVALKDFAPAPRERNRERGDDTAPQAAGAGVATWIPVRAAVIPALGFPGSGAGPWSHNFSFNLLAGEARIIHGLQFSLVHNRSREEMRGLQTTLGFNHAMGGSSGAQIGAIANLSDGRYRGLQLSYGGNLAASLRGAQVSAVNAANRISGLQLGLVNASRNATGAQAGLVNAAVREQGVQAGLMNAAKAGQGMQAGLMNAAGNFRGAQLGLLNAAYKVSGLQLGLVNYAHRADGAVIGAINLIGNGLHDLETTVDEKSMLRTALLLGGTHNYTWYSFDMKALKPRHLWGGSAGLGLQLPRDPFFLGLDLGAGWLSNEEDKDNNSVTGRIRTLMGYRPMRYFSVFGGITYNLEAWPSSQRPNLNPGSDGTAWGEDIRAERWTGFFLGVRL